MAKYWRHICLAIVATGCLTFGSSNAFSELNTYQIKSAYLYQISKFVFWPEQKKQSDYFNLCILGENTYGGNLQKMEARTVFNKPIRLLSVSSYEKSADCHLLILTNPSKINSSAFQQWLSKHAVLTVADDAEHIDKAMVAFVLENQRVRLHINIGLAKQSGLSFAANLLEVASKVKTGDQQ
ncbi:YfiR family protein [Oceaniserpentilla sp. 4NH20-0058]|uniref:YfiR family protein n=1 Tax=Oceaniserpentilla sp. 4NH20-0058 TaxID=3127660 RepID=UPI003340C5FD